MGTYPEDIADGSVPEAPGLPTALIVEEEGLHVALHTMPGAIHPA
jgi:hypothetical protein